MMRGSVCLLCLLWASIVLGLPVGTRTRTGTGTGTGTRTRTGTGTGTRTGTRTGTKLLLISFDGFRWDYDRDVDTPHLDQMARDGVKAQYVTPPYLTITSPTHFTLLTGLYVENHGVVHNMWFNTSSNRKLPYYQTQFKTDWWDNGSLPIWITAQRQGLRSGSLHFPGTQSSYDGENATVREVEPPNYNYKNETAWRENTRKVMGWFRDQDLDFVSMYFGEPDGTGHRYGPKSQQIRDMVQQVDRTVGYIRQTARDYGLEDALNVIITADHGMSDVFRNGLVEEITLSKIRGFSFRDVAFHVLDYGPSGMILPKPGKLETVYQALKGGHPRLHVYKKEELPQRLHFTKSERILPIILWADPGYVINGYFPVQFHRGEHGFDNAEMDMKPFFRAVGPAFARGLEVGPFETVNIYPLMCHLLGIRPEDNDGDLELTRHMLRQEGLNLLPNLFLGLAAVAVFLVVVFVSVLVKKTMQKKNERSKSPEEETETEIETEKDERQTSF